MYAGCHTSFTPIQENDRYYSIFGFLNASADTQFVRIEKLRDGQFSSTPEHLNIDVILTNTTTGEKTVMHDSLFHYPAGDAHNYYTTLPVRPEQTYLLEIKKNQTLTSAQTDIPPSFPEPIITAHSKDSTGIDIRGINRLIAVDAFYYSYLDCIAPPCPDNPIIHQAIIKHLQDTVHHGSLIHVRINHRKDLNNEKLGYPQNRTFTLVRTEVMIAAGNEDWPDFLHLNPETVALPNAVSNVKGGTGILGGIISDTLLVSE